jgi:integrase
LVARALAISGQHYIFEHRLNGRNHRTRQAVFKDLKKACGNFGIKKNVSVHSLRKIYAVDEYEKTGDLKKVQKLLNHSGEAVTMIYAMANAIRKKSVKKR